MVWKGNENGGQSVFDGLLSNYPRLELRQVTAMEFARLHASEPALSSSAKDAESLRYYAAFFDGNLMGACSIFIEVNQVRRVVANCFCRIDLVVVRKEYRRLGVADALLACVLSCILQQEGEHLYSLSCLAAHVAIAEILKGLGFKETIRQGEEFNHEELKIGEGKVEGVSKNMDQRAIAALKSLNFRLRQTFGGVAS